MAELTFTSYAVLGLLSRQPWTAYEIELQSKRSFSFLLPRARSVLYNEPKKLTQRGLAKARPEKRGQRTVNIYEITDEGRAVFRDWLRSRSSLPQLEAEILVRTLFAHEISDADLLEVLRQFHTDADALLQVIEQQGAAYGDGGPFPEQLPYIALAGEFTWRYLALVEEWSAWAEREVAAWPRSKAGKREWANEVIEGFVAEANRRQRARANQRD